MIKKLLITKLMTKFLNCKQFCYTFTITIVVVKRSKSFTSLSLSHLLGVDVTARRDHSWRKLNIWNKKIYFVKNRVWLRVSLHNNQYLIRLDDVPRSWALASQFPTHIREVSGQLWYLPTPKTTIDQSQTLTAMMKVYLWKILL